MNDKLIDILIELAIKNKNSLEEIAGVFSSLIEVQMKQKESLSKLTEKISNISFSLPETEDVNYKEMFKGKDGETPSEEYLLSLIKPLIPNPPSDSDLLEIIKPLIPEPQEINKKDLIKIIESLIPEPKNGYCPVKGIDYFTNKDIDIIIKKVITLQPPTDYKLIAREINKLKGDNRVSYLSLKDTPKLGDFGGDRMGFGSLSNLFDVDISKRSKTKSFIKWNGEKYEHVEITASGGSVFVNGVEITDPNFIDNSDISFNVSSSDITARIEDNSVTNEKLADMPGHTVKARVGGSAGNPTNLALGSHDVLGRNGGNIQSINAPNNTVLRRLTGNTLGFGQVETNLIQNNAVTLQKLAQIGSPRILGRLTAGAGNVEEIPLGSFIGALDIQNSLTEHRIGKTATASFYNVVGSTGNATLGTQLFSVDTLYLQRFIVPEVFVNIPSIAYYITATTANRASFSVYTSDSEGLPDERIKFAGAGTASGLNIISLTAGANIFPKGVYWLALNFNQNTTLRTVQDSQGIGLNSSFDINFIKHFSIAGVSWASPPTNINTSSLVAETTNPPALGIQFNL
jgi:hypothetical protein